MSHFVRCFVCLLIVCSGLAAAAVRAQPVGAADGYPDKPVRFISPFTPGAGTDTTARMLAAHMSELWGQQFVVDNRTGAAGSIGVELTAQAPPDGYTICLISASHSVNSATNPKLPYDLGRDLQGISQATSLFYVVYVNAAVPVKNTRELIEHARANPGKLLFSSSGTGGLQHFAGEMFNHMAGIKMTHVPYKGTAAGIVANLAGDVQVGFGTLFGVRAHWQAGRVRVLAISAGKRSPAVPDVPTVAESGLPGYAVDQWYGVITGARVPEPIVRKIRGGIVDALSNPAIVKRLAADGSTPVGSTPAEFTAYIRSEMTKWRTLAREAGLRLH